MALCVNRGEIVLCVLAGDYGKVRPAVIVQANIFAEHSSVTVCPITSTRAEAPLFRIDLPKDHQHGLDQPSQIMIDKISSIAIKRIRAKLGVLSTSTLRQVDHSLLRWLDLPRSQ